ncbi:DinB family protein [Nocardioides nanhaiensis]|uniref:DinB family protein n=1 Tax=Nocardioides nanhaiensis TaxID=1476871 RepID=A0ABP8WIZ9_9ACTN
MTVTTPGETLVRYLQNLRDALLWKLEGASDYDQRRPLTGTGTNLLGLVKHLAHVELGYFGDTFGRPTGVTNPVDEPGGDDNADMWVTPEETRSDVVGLYKRAWAHAAETFDALGLDERGLDARGRVPWWPEATNEVTLHQVLVHVAVDTARHLGHADILREQLDGAVGLRADVDNLPADYDWVSHHARVEQAAREAGHPGLVEDA